MGLTCSKCVAEGDHPYGAPHDTTSAYNHRLHRHGGVGGVGSSSHGSSARRSSPDAIDPAINEIQRQSWTLTQRKMSGTAAPATSTTAANHQSSSSSAAPLAVGQHHLLYKQKGSNHTKSSKFLAKMPRPESAPQGCGSPVPSIPPSASSLASNSSNEKAFPTRLIVRRHAVRSSEEGLSGTHIYAMRWSAEQPLKVKSRSGKEEIVSAAQEQCPRKGPRNKQDKANHTIILSSSPSNLKSQSSDAACVGAMTGDDVAPIKSPLILPNWNANSKLSEKDAASVTDNLFKPSIMNSPPKQRVPEWITVSEEHNVHILDSGLTAAECDYIVQLTEHLCRGQYAAYTYAKQTLGCREFPMLAAAVQDIVHRVTYSIVEFSNNTNLALDDREPHMVKYDLTKKERQKLDMHTDKSEWTFLISLSNGCGLDYDGGGTYFECLDATVHLQRGHCLVFPGKLRHCGQRISTGLRFLLVGFLVDKSANQTSASSAANSVGNQTVSGENDRDLATALHMSHLP